MSAPQNGRELVELIVKSQLVASEVLDELRPQLARYETAEPLKLAKTLVKNQLITEYHARNLLAGRYQGFYVGKYRILDLLGKGGMGKVFLAEQLTMERLVAVKVIGKTKGKREAETMARFRREAKAVAALNHPNIVHAYDFDELSGSPYIVMEFIEGIDIATLVGRQGPLAPEFAADVMRQAAAGLHQAHKAGMVHRDVKPGNLLIDAEGNVRILDLGLCSLQSGNDDSLTVDKDQLGTVDFVAPEQAVNSHKADHRADIYGLGVSIYCAMTGDVLFPGYSTTQKLIAHQNEEPRNIRELVPSIPDGFADLIHRMIAKKPEDRPQSAAAVHNEAKKWGKRPQPPYNLELIPFRRSKYEGVIGKGPDASEVVASSVASLDDAAGSASSSSSLAAVQSSIVSDPLGANTYNDDQAMTMLELPKARAKKKKGPKKGKKGDRSPMLLWIGAGAALVILLSTVVIQQTLLSVDEPSLAGTNAVDQSPAAPTTNAPVTSPGPRAARSQLVPLSLAAVANANSMQPMFNDIESDRLVLPNWSPRTVKDVRFDLVDPGRNNRPNVILLYGDQGILPPHMPKSVKIPCQHPIAALHMLSGVGAWASPVLDDPVEVMKVRLHYADGQTEDHSLVNGQHFVDYIRRIDVPGSDFAFDMQGRQMRYIQIVPKSVKQVTEIEFIKGPLKGVSPIILAVTVERP